MLVGNYFFRNKGCSGSTLLLRFGVAILLIVSNSVANAGVADSCEDQSKCISLTASEVVDNSGECKVKVCLEPTFGGNCSKSLSETISHSCIKDTDPGVGFAGATAKTGVRDGEIQCQIVPAGTDAHFLLKDGGGCTKDGGGASLADTIDGFDASCQPRPDDVESCTGNKVGVECIWNVTAPNLCSTPTPSVSRAPSGIPSSVPSKSPSVSRAPSGTPSSVPSKSPSVSPAPTVLESVKEPCPILAEAFGPVAGTMPNPSLTSSCEGDSNCYQVQGTDSPGTIAYRNITSDSFEYRAKVCGVGCSSSFSCARLGLGVRESFDEFAPFISVSLVPFGGFRYSYNTGSGQAFSEFLDSGYSAAKKCMWIRILRLSDRFDFQWDYLLGDIEPGKDLCKGCCEDVNCENNTHPNPVFCESSAFGLLPSFNMPDQVFLTLEVVGSSKGEFRDIEVRR